MVTELDSFNGDKSYSIVQFASSGSLVQSSGDKDSTIDSVNGLVYTGARTNHAEAIDSCRNALSGTDHNKYMILITDGVSTLPQPGPINSTFASADLAKGDDINIIPVFITTTSSGGLQVMSTISSDGKVFNVTDFGSLEAIEQELIDQVRCNGRSNSSPSQSPTPPAPSTSSQSPSTKAPSTSPSQSPTPGPRSNWDICAPYLTSRSGVLSPSPFRIVNLDNYICLDGERPDGVYGEGCSGFNSFLSYDQNGDLILSIWRLDWINDNTQFIYNADKTLTVQGGPGGHEDGKCLWSDGGTYPRFKDCPAPGTAPDEDLVWDYFRAGTLYNGQLRSNGGTKCLVTL
ncbi:hypothetical protein THAOC_37148 [Thalassiosira oceanica]|uniref:VWFA domain-containing protein n=1 Tax=Thalassiosira oceanica TaxID=159749 RepID=K0R6P8_THAOC|nr:hypothetical protein THAOC_37148 [Thalassiosira oceanica]|eukprot:EJK44321.1 hypothetical protein THAOC_37148 [Thalassiosira oceanica]